jgi:hypothetical protein
VSNQVIPQQEAAFLAALKEARGVPDHPLNRVNPNLLVGPKVFSNVNVLTIDGGLHYIITGNVQIDFVCNAPEETANFIFFVVPSDNTGTKLISPFLQNTAGSAQIYPQQYSIPSTIDPSQPAYGYQLGNTDFILSIADSSMILLTSAALFGFGSILTGLGWRIDITFAP